MIKAHVFVQNKCNLVANI